MHISVSVCILLIKSTQPPLLVPSEQQLFGVANAPKWRNDTTGAHERGKPPVDALNAVGILAAARWNVNSESEGKAQLKH